MALLVTATVTIAAGDLVLARASYRTRTVLGGVLSVASGVLVGLSADRWWRGSVATAEVAAAAALVIVGTVLLGLGQAFDRLLAGPPEGGRPDAPPQP